MIKVQQESTETELESQLGKFTNREERCFPGLIPAGTNNARKMTGKEEGITRIELKYVFFFFKADYHTLTCSFASEALLTVQ